MQPDFSVLQEVAHRLSAEWQRPAGPLHALTMAALAGYLVAEGATAEDAVAAVRDAEAGGLFPLSVLEAHGVPWYIGGSCAGNDRVHFAWSPLQIHPGALLALFEADSHLPEWAEGLPRSDSWHTALRLRLPDDPPELLTGQTDLAEG